MDALKSALMPEDQSTQSETTGRSGSQQSPRSDRSDRFDDCSPRSDRNRGHRESIDNRERRDFYADSRRNYDSDRRRTYDDRRGYADSNRWSFPGHLSSPHEGRTYRDLEGRAYRDLDHAPLGNQGLKYDDEPDSLEPEGGEADHRHSAPSFNNLDLPVVRPAPTEEEIQREKAFQYGRDMERRRIQSLIDSWVPRADEFTKLKNDVGMSYLDIKIVEKAIAEDKERLAKEREVIDPT